MVNIKLVGVCFLFGNGFFVIVFMINSNIDFCKGEENKE